MRHWTPAHDRRPATSLSPNGDDLAVPDPVPTSLPSRSIIPPLWLPTLVALAVAVAAAWLSGRSEISGFDPHLALLLRFMAALKASTAVGASALLTWRLRRPIGPGGLGGYLAGLALMAAAPALIWSPAHVALGAICFHAGLFAVLICALRDDALGAGRRQGLPRTTRR